MPFAQRVKPYWVRMACGHFEVRKMREATAGMPWDEDAVVKSDAPCGLCRGDAAPLPHVVDTQCVIDPELDECAICGVGFGDACPECLGRGFHNPGCQNS
jgi:hypothetical protein